MSRALIVEDHPLMRQAIRVSLEPVFGKNISEATSLSEAFAILEADPGFDLTILDLQLGDSASSDTLVAMRERFPEIPILVYTADSSAERINNAFERLVSGFVPKSSPAPILVSAVQLVLAGGIYIPPEAAKVLASRESPRLPVQFSVRQEQVFRLLAQGMPNKVIASRLGIAEGTVKSHLGAVYVLLGVHSRLQAILRAAELGLH